MYRLLLLTLIIVFGGVAIEGAARSERQYVEVRVVHADHGFIAAEVTPPPVMIFKSDSTFKPGESMTCELFEDQDEIKCSGDRELTPMGAILAPESDPRGSTKASL